ncbi:MAG: roadblock/LC7 domain-containing protein [Planctomycetes bacterium]|nr:roadblock/LC7 domain-containing protein [Planctomycetota bacterium]
MKTVLDPLARIPGVRLAALISSDGVPIDVRRNESTHARREGKDSKDAPDGSAEDLNALAALSSSWISEVTRAVAPMSWDVPKRLVLHAARGTLIVVQAPRALLLVVLEGGVRPEEMRLPMGVAIARMERHLRAIEPKAADPSRAPTDPPGIFPAQKTASKGAEPIHAKGNEVPKGSGE